MTDSHRLACDCPRCELIAQQIAEELAVAAAEQLIRVWGRSARRSIPTIFPR